MTATPAGYSTLARRIAATARHIAECADAMETATFHADGLPPDKMREVANTLRGAAMRAAMAANDTGLLGELTGRTWTALHRQEEGGE